MKNLVMLCVVGVLCLASYLFGVVSGETSVELPPADWVEDSESARAWRELAASLEAAGAEVYGTTRDPRERSMGLHYLAQLASAALEMQLAKGDPAAPAFTDWMSDYRKFLGDSPDAVYHTAAISADHRYRIIGNRGEAGYLGFMLYGRSLNGWNRAADNISSESINFDEQGNFSLLLSREKPADYDGDWLALEDDIHMVMVRQYFHEREGSRQARFSIRNLDPATYTQPVDAETAAGIRAATTFFNDTLRGNLALMEMLARRPNTAEPPREYNQDFGGIFYPTHDNTYFGTWYELQPGTAIVVEGVAPEVDYWSISLQNRWMQSYDYRHHRVSLNNREIELDDARRYRVVIAQEPVAEANWLSAAGFPHGLLAIRYQLATAVEAPTITVVPLDSLR